MQDIMPLVVSILLNILLLILAILFRKTNTRLYTKLQDLERLVTDFLEAYKDKVITPDEAEKLINDIKKLVEDP